MPNSLFSPHFQAVLDAAPTAAFPSVLRLACNIIAYNTDDGHQYRGNTDAAKTFHGRIRGN